MVKKLLKPIIRVEIGEWMMLKTLVYWLELVLLCVIIGFFIMTA